MNLKRFFVLVGLTCLGIGTVILGIKNSRLKEENNILKRSLENLNEQCDKKDRYIGKILTEFRKS